MWFFPRNSAIVVMTIVTGVIVMFAADLDKVTYVNPISSVAVRRRTQHNTVQTRVLQTWPARLQGETAIVAKPVKARSAEGR
jgi:hypothetical protein